MDKIVFVRVYPPHDSMFLSTMNALEDLEEYENFRLQVASRSELIEDLTFYPSVGITPSNKQVMVH